jgi:cytochrome b561
MTAAPGGHPCGIRVLHWLTAALLLFAYPLAWSVEAASSAEVAQRLLMLHRSLGVTILALTLARLAWRLSRPVPALPPDLPAWQRLAARANALGLYLLLLAQPALGLAASWFHGDRLVLFGIGLPMLAAPDRPLGRLLFRLHGTAAILLLALVAVHVAAALYHHFVRRDEVVSGMLLPVRRATDKPLGERSPS